MTARELVAIFEGREVGRVEEIGHARLRFVYDEEWRRGGDAFPLSLAMPLAGARHGHEPISAYLSGLLPDNEEILSRWGQRFQVSARNPFALISHVGEDCAGAVQFVRPERWRVRPRAGGGTVAWLTRRDVGRRLRVLSEDASAGRMSAEEGQFSLAGAQSKTALLFDGRRWGIPSGGAPTTHILKPAPRDFAGHPFNEHVCLALARDLGLAAAASRLVAFGTELAVAIERFDRLARGADVATYRRLHQEDMCQALALPPFRKYQNEGGPSPERIVALLREHSGAPAEDVATFVDALAFNWLLAGTDAHAKNYALLHGAGGRVRLAPLYDVASALPYPNLDPRKMKLAMKIGGEYRLENVARRHWLRFAEGVRLDPEATVARIARMAQALPERLAAALRSLRATGPAHPILARLESTLIARARSCLAMLRRA